MMIDTFQWNEPRRVDQWWWMDIELIDPHTGNMVRCGRVSWNQDGTGFYAPSISFEREGYGFYCFPTFRALSEAQTFVEGLMSLTLEEAMQANGVDWRLII